MKFRFFIKGLIAVLPSFLKRPIYRHVFGYTIGKRVKIGLSIIDAATCSIGDDAVIGHLNLFIGTKELVIGDNVKVAHFNMFRGGDLISIGRYCEILRFNEFNSMPALDVVNKIDPVFILGDGSMVSSWHKIDFTDRVEIGDRVVLGGRNSSLWTHNRQMTKPIRIGDRAYVGSEIRIVPGGEIPAKCIVGIGSVITKKLEGEHKLIAGVPAKVLNDLDDDGIFLIDTKPRHDMPDEIGE